jgi:hypothetical protein
MKMGMRISSGMSGAQGVSQGGAAAWQQRQQSFQALSSALQSGNLDQAKAAYAKLTAGASNPAASTSNSPLAQLGKALQAGDLGAAQQALASMRTHHGRTGGAPASATTPSAPTATTGNSLNVIA